MINLFENVFGCCSDNIIRAYFSDGSSDTYTMAIFDLLKSDYSVDCIIDNDTGEILFSR